MAPGIDRKNSIRLANGLRTSVGLAFSPTAPGDQTPLAALGAMPRAIVAGLMRALQPNHGQAHRHVGSDQMSFRPWSCARFGGIESSTVGARPRCFGFREFADLQRPHWPPHAPNRFGLWPSRLVSRPSAVFQSEDSICVRSDQM